MIYSVEITDANNETVGGSGDILITFTVEKIGDGWIITDKDEEP